MAGIFRSSKNETESGQKKYSYIKMPLSKEGWYSIIISLVVFAVTLYILIKAAVTDGAAGTNEAAAGLWCLMMCLVSVWFSTLSFRRKDRDSRLALAGGILSLTLLLAWVLIIRGGN